MISTNWSPAAAEEVPGPKPKYKPPPAGGGGGGIPPVETAPRQAPVAAVASKKKPQASFLEVFCGYGGLTKAMQQQGWKALGIDYGFNKDKPIGASVYIDLSTAAGQEAFWQLIHDRQCIYVHFAPPCGTASRAREKRIYAGYDPKPLRTDAEPDGLSGLPERDQTRVNQANTLYEFVANACLKLSAMGIEWSIENPKNSLLWLTSWMLKLKAGAEFNEVHFQHCMHGGTRDKRTMLWVSSNFDLSALFAACDGKHTHTPWGVSAGRGFATAQERNYPALLCSRWARLATKDFEGKFGPVKVNLQELSVGTQKAKGLPDDKLQKVFRELQPRRGMQELIPEYKEVWGAHRPLT